MNAEIKTVYWGDIEARELTAGGWRALVCAGMGCSCVSLTHSASGASLLRTPPDAETFRANPNVYGTPLLFPPNRVKDGTFTFEGRRYELPLNEPARGHHIHGFLSSTPFDVTAEETADGAARLVCQYRAAADRPYSTFPHAFHVVHETLLDFEGLHQRVTVTNDGDLTMPLGLGFHTALRAPALPGANPASQRLSLSAGRKWIYDERIIPTGETTDDDPVLEALRGDGVVPCERPVSIHCEMTGGTALLRDLDNRCATLYRVSDDFKYWMIWNGSSKDGFICPEPQTNMVDFVNRPFGDDVTGLIRLSAGESRSVRALLTFIKL